MLLTRPPDFAAPVARGLRARPEWALQGGYQSRVLGKTRVQELKSPPPVGGQAQMKAGTAAQGIGSLGARREGGGSCCMIEFMRQQRASPCLAFRQTNK